jgi:hypothetical protein
LALMIPANPLVPNGALQGRDGKTQQSGPLLAQRGNVPEG